MKKIIFILAVITAAAVSFSCTQNSLARQFGADITVSLPKGETVQCATWKESTLWLTTVDTSGVIRLREHNSFGWKSGSVTFN